MIGWLKIAGAATYASVCKNTVRSWLKCGLRHSRVGGVILIKRETLDLFIEEYADSEKVVDKIADEVLSEVLRK